MRILIGKSGKGQLIILSSLAREPDQQQNQLVENTILSKGSVSNNVRKLREKGLLEGEDQINLNQDKILKHYREHIEAFLVRDSSDPEQLNDVRTEVKTRVTEIIDLPELEEYLIAVLGEAQDREDLESLNSVFKETDRVIRETANSIDLKMIGLVTDKSNQIVEKSKIAEESEKILEEVSNE